MMALHILFGTLTPEGDRLCRFSRRTVPHKWRLLRLDDNGNSFVVADYKTRPEALNAQRYYEKKGHKQTYWVEKFEPVE